MRQTDNDLGDFDWFAFAHAVRKRFHDSNTSARKLAPKIGITYVDLSRAMGGGQRVSVPKVIALCLWMRRNIFDFYVFPAGISRRERFTCNQVKHMQ